MTTPVVSVVIPTYNSRGLVVQSIRSALASTLREIEVIVVDDGSDDDTAAVVAALDDPRVMLLRQANCGIGPARNRGIEAARAEFIAFLDHDDLWAPNCLEVQVTFLRGHPDLGCAICQWNEIDDPAARGLDDSIEPGRMPDILRSLSQGALMLMSACLIVRSTALRDLRYPTQAGAMEDVPFYIQLFQRTAVGVSSLEPLMHYRRHRHNASSDAAYFMSGAFKVLEMRAQGQLASGGAQAYAAFVCRQACRKLARQGLFASAWRTYVAVLPLQLQLRRWAFVAGMPAEILGCALVGRRAQGR